MNLATTAGARMRKECWSEVEYYLVFIGDVEEKKKNE